MRSYSVPALRCPVDHGHVPSRVGYRVSCCMDNLRGRWRLKIKRERRECQGPEAEQGLRPNQREGEARQWGGRALESATPLPCPESAGPRVGTGGDRQHRRPQPSCQHVTCLVGAGSRTRQRAPAICIRPFLHCPLQAAWPTAPSPGSSRRSPKPHLLNCSLSAGLPAPPCKHATEPA